MDAINFEIPNLGRSVKNGRTASGQGRGEEAALRRAAEQFESLFIRQMLKAMRSTAKDPLLGDGTAGHVVQSMFDDNLAERIAEQGGGLGFADYLLQGLNRISQSPVEEKSAIRGNLSLKF